MSDVEERELDSAFVLVKHFPPQGCKGNATLVAWAIANVYSKEKNLFQVEKLVLVSNDLKPWGMVVVTSVFCPCSVLDLGDDASLQALVGMLKDASCEVIPSCAAEDTSSVSWWDANSRWAVEATLGVKKSVVSEC